MLRQLAAKGTRGQPVHLVYGVTRDDDLVEVETLQALAAQIPGFTYATVVADPASDHRRKGYVTDHIDAARSTPARSTSTSAARRRWSTPYAAGLQPRA